MFPDIQQHTHNGIDSPRLDPRSFKGFPVYQTETLDFTPPEGTVVIRNKTSDSTYYLAVFLGGIWREVELTSIAS